MTDLHFCLMMIIAGSLYGVIFGLLEPRVNKSGRCVLKMIRETNLRRDIGYAVDELFRVIKGLLLFFGYIIISPVLIQIQIYIWIGRVYNWIKQKANEPTDRTGAR